jgi:UDP-glucose 4-epimerase
MNILLTGATGFVGSFFIQKYNKKYNIKTFSFLKNNIQKLELTDIDTIVHLSALVHQMGGASREEYNTVNVMQTLRLAKKAKDNGVAHFIFMSTVKVYGEETDTPYVEHSECYPRDEYGKSKLKAEFELLKLEDNHFKISIIRTPIVYGYGVKANIKNLIDLIKKIPILPFASIQNRRSMIYNGNLCHLMDVLIEKKVKNKITESIFLAKDNESGSTTKLIMVIAKILDKKVYLIKIPFFENILKIVKPSFHKRLYQNLEIDNSSTRQILDLHNPYTLEEGMYQMLISEIEF